MDADEDRKKEWESLEVTRDEMETLTKCMKEKEFRRLLMEYADEINDPENRKLYEAEITQLEKERGIDVTFVNPEPGYVIKTSVDGRTKCFVNISKSKCVGKPLSEPGTSADGDGARGYNWSIPYILSPPRDDLDKSKTRCRVFDVVFHPETLRLAEGNINFRNIVNDTAMDGIENNFKVKLDRKNLKFPKMNFKGMNQPTVIRKPCEKPVKKSDIEPEIYQKLMSSYDTSRERWLKTAEEKCARPTPTTTYFKSRINETDDKNSEYTKPKFVVKYQSSVEMDEFRESKDAKMYSVIPKNLVIVINLPLLKSADYATLDVQERHLMLKSEKPAKYHLELPLSYRVDPDNGNAKFDSKLRRLTVTLPVIRDISFLLDTKEDNGVESEHGSPLPESKIISSQSLSEDLSDSEKPENGSLICVLTDNDKVQSDCADTALRTSEDKKTAVPFMNPNKKYSLPPYTCNLYDNLFAITTHVKNVDPESIDYKILEDNAGLHILLTSIGAGFFPLYYSLCLKIEKDAILPDTLTVEPWDNNVVLSIQIKNPEMFSRYFAGINEELMEAKDLSVAAFIKNKLQALTEDPEIETDKNVEVIRNENEIIVNVCSESIDSDDDEDHESKLNSQRDERKRSLVQSRSVSESSGDELASSIASSTGSERYKSILKSGQNHFSRSVSESSIDDTVQSLSTTPNEFEHEFNSECEGSSLKKTVRFNDVIFQKLFRSNSSIFGQRKKNQRKRKNKKRAYERRLSESENSEGEEREKYKVDVQNKKKQVVSDTIRPILH